MVLTRWSRNLGSLVTPDNANIWSGSLTLPVIASTLDINVHTLIDADLGGIFVLIPFRVLVTIAYRVVLTLNVANISSRSIYQSNPPRRKLGVATYLQGIYAFDSEAINYENCVLKQQGFIFLERTSEPSLDTLPAPVIPESRDYLVTPNSPNILQVPTLTDNYGCTRTQLYFEPGIVGIAEVKYTAALALSSIPDFGASFTVSQV